MVKPGKYEFYVTAIFGNKQDGTPLVSQKTGKPYKSVRYMVIGPTGESGNIYQSYFGGKDNDLRLAESIGDNNLIEKVKSDNFDISNTIGCGGMCLVGVKKSAGYPDINQIECFLKKDASAPVARKESLATADLMSAGDGLPF
jgi:hypothetical protein